MKRHVKRILAGVGGTAAALAALAAAGALGHHIGDRNAFRYWDNGWEDGYESGAC